MTDRRETILNVEREPATRIYNDGGSGYGLLAGVVIAVLVIGLFALLYFRQADTVVSPAPNVTIEAPNAPAPAPAPEPQPANPAAPEAPAPANP